MTRPLRILAVNPNTSTEVTEAFVAAAQRCAPADVAIDGVTGAFGATIVSYEAENVIAAYAALDLIASHAAGYDAVILAISFDTALVAAREVLSVPVIGITHAAYVAASMGGRSVGVVSFGAVSLPLYQRVIEGYGFHPVAYEVVEIASTADYLEPMVKDRAVLHSIAKLAAAGADAVVICGSAIVGMAERLSKQAPLPLYDGAASVQATIDAIRGGGEGHSPVQPVGTSTGLSKDLAALIGGSWPK